ncbi:MAG: DUF2436 domain-containing protein [Bacteroidales bacterium]|nr:DUF2436 domain-containing protein [Bacteroidales bacterium]
MKKGLLFLSLVLGLGVANAQNTDVLQTRNGSKESGLKQVVNANHKPTTFTVINNAKTPIPAGHARVSLTAGDVWGDGSGYQLLLDADATAFGNEIPATGPLTVSGDVPAAIYSVFEYKIPTNADGSLTTTNIVMNNTIAIDVPVGTYDWVITNPTADDRMWIAGQGRGDDQVFAEGVEYKFTVALVGTGDVTTLEVIDPNAPIPTINWDFQDGEMPAHFTIYNDNNTPAANASLFTDGWNVIALSDNPTALFAAATSYFTNPVPADRWMVTAKINLTTGNSLSFDVKSQDPDYLESMSVKLSTTTAGKNAFTTELWSSTAVPATYNTHTFDLSSYSNQSIYIAFVLNSTDAFFACVDNIKIFGQATATAGLNDVATSSFGVYPNPASDFVTVADANGAEVRVVDMLGRTLISKVSKSNSETISTSNLESGMYMIQIIKDGKTSTHKLIVR